MLKKGIDAIEKGVKAQSRIIADILDISRIEAGKLSLELEPVKVKDLLESVGKVFSGLARQKQLRLSLSIDERAAQLVWVDAVKLKQIVSNLLGNAIKFTEGGNIDILVEKRALSNTKVQIEVQIRDTGIGIPERDQSRLFQAFRQADASISRRHGGTGLGLVITQKLVNEMGGDISFHSQPNRGSTFWFHISLDLNPNVLIDRSTTRCLAGKRLAYVEPNAAAAQCALDILSTTPLEVVYSPTFSALAVEHYDILLMCITYIIR